MVLALALLVVHLGRLFDYVLTAYHIPAVICGAAIVAAIVGGGLPILRTRTGWAFILLVAWMMMAVPFSYWRGGSVSYVWNLVALPFVAMLIFAAAPQNARDVKRLFYVTAVCAVLNLAAGTRLNPTADDRLGFEGTFGNSDDVAILAGFAIPFWVFLTGRIRPVVPRVLLQGAGAAWLLRIVGLTATRTAVIALGAMFLAYLMSLSTLRRVLIGGAVAAAVALLALSLPDAALQRFATMSQLTSVSGQPVAAEDEALGSLAARQALMLDALRITIRHPLVGVGPGQFGNYRGEDPGTPRSWQAAHSAYLQVSSESGIPALIFYLVFLASIFMTIRNVRKLSLSTSDPGWSSGSSMALCLQLACVYLVISALFMCITEYIYPFILAGLALASERLLSPDRRGLTSKRGARSVRMAATRRVT
jgi:O-antigen ligase